MNTEQFLIYTIQMIPTKGRPDPTFMYESNGRMKGFETEAEARTFLDNMTREPEYWYKVVYGREYTKGDGSPSTFAEGPGRGG
jgi:hypothetical protein